MTAPGGGDDRILAVRAVWIDEASQGVQKLRAEFAGLQTGAGQFSAAVGPAMVRQLGAVGQSAEGATGGFGRLQRSVVQFGLAAAGVPGPVGRVASSLSMFAAGGGATVAAVGGLALVTAAFRALTAEAREARDRTNEAVKAIVELGKGTPEARREETAAQLARAQEREAQLRAQIKALAEAPLTRLQVSPGGLQEMVALTDRERQARIRAMLDLSKQLLDVVQGIVVAEEQVGDPASLGRRVGRFLAGITIPSPEQFIAPPVPETRAPWRDVLPETFIGNAEQIRDEFLGLSEGARLAAEAIAEVRGEIGPFAFGQALAELDRQLEEGRITAEERAEAEKKLRGEMEETTKKSKQLEAALLSLVSSQLEATVAGRGGSPLSFIGGLAKAGGAALGLTPLGIGLTLGGAILSGLGGRDRTEKPIAVTDQRVREELARVRMELAAANRRRPQQVSYLILDSSGRAIRGIREGLDRENALMGGDL